MISSKKKIRIGFIGCGAIGSRLARAVRDQLRASCVITGFHDIEIARAQTAARRLRLPGSLAKPTLSELLRSCDFIVEAVASDATTGIIRRAVAARKDILVMSAGKVLNHPDILRLAQKNRTALLIPSGAIGALDAIKAMGPTNITRLTLTTRKPPHGLVQSDYLTRKGIDLKKITKDTMIFDGKADAAVRLFPQNINVAATLALASSVKDKMRIRIMTSPAYQNNSHEIKASGKTGCVHVRTESIACPDNPKTSYLAVLSALQTLKQFFNPIKIGT